MWQLIIIVKDDQVLIPVHSRMPLRGAEAVALPFPIIADNETVCHMIYFFTML